MARKNITKIYMEPQKTQIFKAILSTKDKVQGIILPVLSLGNCVTKIKNLFKICTYMSVLQLLKHRGIGNKTYPQANGIE